MRETGEEQTPRKKNVLSRSRRQGGGAERFWAFRDRKDSHGGRPAVAEWNRNAGLLAGPTGLPRGCPGSG